MATEIPIECLSGEVLGCTYPNATNYDPLATFDDGSCTFPAVSTGDTFGVNIFASHYNACGVFYLHVLDVTGDTIPTNFHMFIKLFSYDYRYDTLPSGCLDYQNSAIGTIGTEDRYTQSPRKPQVLYFDDQTPDYHQSFSTLTGVGESDFDFTINDSHVPVSIEIYADGVKYTGSAPVPMNTFSGAVVDDFYITVTQ